MENDDVAFLTEPIDGTIVLSVSASLVADLFDRTDAEVATDLRNTVARLERARVKAR